MSGGGRVFPTKKALCLAVLRAGYQRVEHLIGENPDLAAQEQWDAAATAWVESGDVLLRLIHEERHPVEVANGG